MARGDEVLRNIYDESTNTIGVNGSLTTQESAAIDYFSGNTTATHTNFGGTGATGTGISLTNDGSETFTFTVGSLTISIPSEEGYEGSFTDFTSIAITIPTTCNYRLIILG